MDCILKLKNNKARGQDIIINEFLKSTKDKMINIYVKLFNLILSTGLIPEQWLTSIIQPIYKSKGEKNDVDNYRAISLLSCFGKMFTAVVNNRLSKFLENSGVLGEEQAGFRKGYSTLAHVFTFKCLLDLYTSKKKRLYCCFVDYRKAFDTIDRTNLWRKLLANDINGRIFKVIHNLYKGAKTCVRENG